MKKNENWKSAASAVAQLPPASKERYFKNFPDRKEWFMMHYPELFGDKPDDEKPVNRGKIPPEQMMTTAEIEAQKARRQWEIDSMRLARKSREAFGGIRPGDLWSDEGLISAARSGGLRVAESKNLAERMSPKVDAGGAGNRNKPPVETALADDDSDRDGQESNPRGSDGIDEIPLNYDAKNVRNTNGMNTRMYKSEKISVNESAPPGMEGWIRDRKEGFKKQYGDRWEEVLYSAAWKEYNKRND